MEAHPARITIFGVRIDNVTMRDAVSAARDMLRSGKDNVVATVNPEFLMEARQNEAFRSVLNRTSLNVPDGIGLKFVCWMRGVKLQERVTGADLLVAFAALAEEEKKRVFLFGAGHGVARAAADALQRTFPKLLLVGAENEYDEHGTRRSDNEVYRRINSAAPDLLFVALGAPKQELWIDAALSHMPSVRLAMGVGGSFEYLSNRVPRAPKMVQRLWLEWLWRLLLQPSRWKRIVTATILFPLTVFRTPHAIIAEPNQ